MTGLTARLLSALLPPSWPDRRALLDAASRLDIRHGSASADVLLAVFDESRHADRLPHDPDLADLVIGLRVLLGGLAESRLPGPDKGAAS